MTQQAKNQPEGKSKTKTTKSRSRNKTFNPDKLVSDIERQTLALNMLISKLGKQTTAEELPKIPKTKTKSGTNKP